MDDADEARAAAGRGPLQHLQVAVRIAEGEDRAAADEAVDADGLPGPSSMNSTFGSFIRTGLPSAPILNCVTPEEPTTCSGGMP